MNLTILLLSLVIVLLIVIGFYSFLSIKALEEDIKVLRQDNAFLDLQLTSLAKQIHKNQHNIEKQLLKG
jgi:cell division protein FtsB